MAIQSLSQNLVSVDVSHRVYTYGQLERSGAVWSRGGRPGLPVPDSSYGLCGRKATLDERTKHSASLATTAQ